MFPIIVHLVETCHGASLPVFIWAMPTCLATFPATKAMCRAFIFAMPFKLAILFHKHLDTDADKSNGYNNQGNEKQRPKHNSDFFGKNSFFLHIHLERDIYFVHLHGFNDNSFIKLVIGKQNNSIIN